LEELEELVGTAGMVAVAAAAVVQVDPGEWAVVQVVQFRDNRHPLRRHE
jgi:hypothetical protein